MIVLIDNNMERIQTRRPRDGIVYRVLHTCLVMPYFALMCGMLVVSLLEISEVLTEYVEEAMANSIDI